MANKPEDIKLKLSPNVRLRMTFEREMLLDKEEQVFNNDLYQKYLRMHEKATVKQEALLKSVMISDGILALFLSGKNITIPYTALSIRDFPAALEILTLYSSFGFMALCLAFANAQAYQAICEQFTNRIAFRYNIDPDFVSAADIFTQFHFKLYRYKMNIFGIDFFKADQGYRLFYTSLSTLLMLAMLSIIALHLSLVGYAIWLILSLNWVSILLCSSVLIVNLCGLLANISPSFNFTVSGSEEVNNTTV